MKLVLKKSTALLIGLAFIASLFLSLSMPRMQDGSMKCLFMTEHHMVCPMQALEHFNLWKQSFIAFMAAGVLMVSVRIFKKLSAPAFAISHDFHTPNLRLLSERNEQVRFHDHVMRDLARGRLQPKIYDRA